jgi:3-oxoacyl-[acyl-carrier protein] reductase
MHDRARTCYNFDMSVSQDGVGVSLNLTGKVALVTGGSRGIGAATVRLFRQAGAKVVFSYKSASRQADELVAECGGEEFCRAIQHDLETVHDGMRLVAHATQCFGRINTVVVNHGIWPPQDRPISMLSINQWEETIGVNLNSVFGVVHAAVSLMLPNDEWAAIMAKFPEDTPSWTDELREQYLKAIQRPLAPVTPDRVRGHIVLVASTAAQRGEAFHADYAASKGALLSLTKSLSSELAPQGILCNCVAPGWVRTEMSAGTLSDPEASKKPLSLIPLGRPAEPEEIAGPILFLCTPWAGFVSGEIFNVNGGAVLVG